MSISADTTRPRMKRKNPAIRRATIWAAGMSATRGAMLFYPPDQRGWLRSAWVMSHYAMNINLETLQEVR